VLAQVRYMAKYFYYYGGLADKIQGHVVPMDRPKVFNYIRYEPMGVVVSITPWNSSLSLTAWKMAPALCAGNTVICKPSEYTSASLLEFAKLVVEAGLPRGVVNVLTGYGSEVAEPLVRHRHVHRIAFTGGDEAGRRINKMAAEGLQAHLSRARRQVAQHRLRRRRHGAGRERRSQRHLFGDGSDLRCRLAPAPPGDDP
jgi:aldehyde dehydrogenase (NAD+)